MGTADAAVCCSEGGKRERLQLILFFLEWRVGKSCQALQMKKPGSCSVADVLCAALAGDVCSVDRMLTCFVGGQCSFCLKLSPVQLSL